MRKINIKIEDTKRFQFGDNWKSFLNTIDSERIKIAEQSLKEKMGSINLENKTFLDIGCGSGIFSLSAINLNANKVHSFDYDYDSVECAKYLKTNYKSNSNWTIEEGSVLDEDYIKSLGEFDIVYSWGVLHHTGNMFKALNNAAIPVKKGGILFISIYNHQGWKSRIWFKIKKMYNKNIVLKQFLKIPVFSYFIIGGLLIDIFYYRLNPILRYSEYKKHRGMSIYHDWIDWLGGFPFEYAKPETIFNFFKKKGFILEKLNTKNGHGCNEFIFRKI